MIHQHMASIINGRSKTGLLRELQILLLILLVEYLYFVKNHFYKLLLFFDIEKHLFSGEGDALEVELAHCYDLVEW